MSARHGSAAGNDAFQEADGGLRGLDAPEVDDIDRGVAVDTIRDGTGEAIEIIVLLGEHRRDVDVAEIGNDQLQAPV